MNEALVLTCTFPPHLFLYSLITLPSLRNALTDAYTSKADSNHQFPVIECVVDGRWTRWGDWEQCSLTCGGGVQVSRRSCTDPAPAFEGANCEGDSLRSRSCNEEECPGNYV